MKEPLSQKERARFTACKQQVSEGLQSCFDTGLALLEIKQGKLYREEFDTFEEFCQGTYQIGKSYAYRLIESAEVKMSPIGDKIENESQARVIAQVPEELRPKVLSVAAKTGDLTAQSIAAAAEKVVGAMPSAGKSDRKDAIGRIIPEEVLPDWERAAKIANQLRSCASEIKVTVERALADKDIVFAEITNPTIAEASGLHYTLSQIAPHAVCPSCQGKGRARCQLCRKRGFISKYLWNSPAVSSETKAIIEKVARK